MKISFTRDGWEDYTSWANERAALKRINRMIEEAVRDPGAGIGKPERLSHNLSGYWSRRITDEQVRRQHQVGEGVTVSVRGGFKDEPRRGLAKFLRAGTRGCNARRAVGCQR